MSESYTRLARDRLQRLSATLVLLRERVRDAVASEMGKAVGEALRDLLTAILTRKAIIVPAPHDSHHVEQSQHDRWDDDDDEAWEDRRNGSTTPETPLTTAPVVPAVAVGLGVGITRWLLQRRVPLWAGLGAGLLATLAAFSPHPVLRATLGVVAAATELIALTDLASATP